MFATTLIRSPKLPELMKINSERLASAYRVLTSFLKSRNVAYIPANAGLYVFARVAPKASTWEDETAQIARIKEAGVLVSSGKSYHVPESEKGWARIGFAIPTDQLTEAIHRLDTVFSGDGLLAEA